MDMDGRLPLILDGGESAVGVESTVVAVTGEHPMILRPGYVTKEQWKPFWARKFLSTTPFWKAERRPKLRVPPGMKYKHYAPQGGCDHPERQL